MKKISVFYIIISGMLWGCMGVFSNALNQIGFTTTEASAIRLITCGIIFATVNSSKLKIHLKDIWMFILIGIVSILTMTVTYFESIQRSSLTLASVLLYTAPVMVTIMSCVFFKETLNLKKIFCLTCAIIGIIMISGLDSKVKLTYAGLLYGLLSAVSYALYSIIGKLILKKYEPVTISSYAFIFAAMGSLLIINPIELSEKISNCNIQGIILMFACGIITAAIPYTLYTKGLKFIPAGKASVLACVEPLTATVIGICFYGDSVGFLSAIGIFLILGSVCLLSYE